MQRRTHPAPRGLVLALAALCIAPSAAAGADKPAYGLSVEVTLSPKAAALLAEKHEAITVSAMYLGRPVPSKKSEAAPDGTIALGSEDLTLPASGGRAVVTGTHVVTSRVKWVKSLQISINVYSARHSSPDNLLDCDAFQDAIANVHGKTIPIHCKLIDET